MENEIKDSRRDAERQRAQSGNAAKMRKALEKMTDWMEKHTAMFSVQVSPRKDDPIEVERERDEAISLARAALAAPARNCDVGTAEDKVERFGEYCISHKATLPLPDRCRRCRIRGEIHVHKCIFEWGQMPYNESEVSHGNV